MATIRILIIPLTLYPRRLSSTAIYSVSPEDMDDPMFSIHNLLHGYIQELADGRFAENSETEILNKGDKEKKVRTSFTKNQIVVLEQRFASQKYLTSVERAALAEELKMSDAQVKTWFQNRRTKWRRHESELREQHRRTATGVFTPHCSASYNGSRFLSDA